MEINSTIREAVASSLTEIETIISQDLEERLSLYVNGYIIFIKESFIRFSLSFIDREKVHRTYGYSMPVLLWDIRREKIEILQKGRKEESDIDYKSALSGSISENYHKNKNNMVIGNILIYPRSS